MDGKRARLALRLLLCVISLSGGWAQDNGTTNLTNQQHSQFSTVGVSPSSTSAPHGTVSPSNTTVIVSQTCSTGVSSTSSVAVTTASCSTGSAEACSTEGPTEGTSSPALTEPTDNTTTPPSDDEEVSAETQSSRSVFLILSILGVCVFTVHFLIHFKIHFFPESIAVIIIGAVVGLFLFIIEKAGGVENAKTLGQFIPSEFFLILLPPIIFESGYSLHKGNFFQNLGSIVMFAVFGTAISALIVGGGIYVLGLISIVEELDLYQSFAFGCLISAVDPVATLAIFHALDVDPTLNMLVFGESVLNDAVSIVMTKTVLNARKHHGDNTSMAGLIFGSFGNFLLMFLGSAFIGVLFALVTALLTKHVHLRKTPSLELAMLLVFSFLPYFISESLDLSGIMAILFCGIVMSHYAHHNLSPVTQITIQQILRSAAFMAETCVFAYLGLALFTSQLYFSISLVVWSIVLCLAGRAVNIFPLSALVNRFRSVRITFENQFIMWFSGLRGAVAFALVLMLTDWEEATLKTLVTTTLIIVLFTIVILGGSTLPILKFMKAYHNRKGRRSRRGRKGDGVTLSKTEDQGAAVVDTGGKTSMLKGFAKFDANFLQPFFTRLLSKEELKDARALIEQAAGPLMTKLTDQESDSELLFERRQSSASPPGIADITEVAQS